MCGQNDGAVRNCLNTGDVTTSGNSTSDHAGGVCGYNQSSVNENSGIVENCLNTGEVTATGSASYAGGVCGSNYGTVTHCYWLNTACDNGIGSSDDQQKATPKTSEQLASGAVAYLLNGSTSVGDLAWRQNLDNVEEAEKDPFPVLEALDPGHGIVYPIKNEESGEIARYSNYPGGKRTISGCTVTLSTSTFTYNGEVQKPEVTVVWEKNTTLIEGTDYTVTFSGNCIDAGTYTITITGIGQYTGTATATYTIKAAETGGETGGNTGGSSSSGGSHRPARDDGPSTGHSDGWKDIREEIRDAEDGDTITIDMGDETEVPGEIFEEVAGKDVTVEFELEDGVSWTVNGQDIPTDTGLSDLDLGVSMDSRGIPVNVFNAITGEYSTVQFTLSHDGPFGFTLTLAAPLGRDNAGYWANLYYYNEKGRELEFRQAARIGRDGRAEFLMDHASQYAVVIDDKSHEPEPLPFSDVPEDHWAYDAIQYVYGEGLMAGTSATTFAPEVTTSRAMIATILWRMAGSPVVNYAMNYTDVAQGQWCSEAIRWATSEGVVTGYGNGLFGTNDPITREQLAVMLHRYAQHEGYDVSIGEDTNILSYADAFTVSEYAVSALQWACGAGIISGTGDGSTLTPQGEATRAQAAVMLMRFCEQSIQ